MESDRVPTSGAAKRAPRIEAVAGGDGARVIEADPPKPKVKRTNVNVAVPKDVEEFFKAQQEKTGLKWQLLLIRTLRDDIDQGLTFSISAGRSK